MQDLERPQSTLSSAQIASRWVSAIVILIACLVTSGCVTMDEFARAIEAANQQRAGQVYQYEPGYQSEPEYQYETQPQYYQLVQDSGLCLDVHGPHVRRNGGKVQTWACHGGDNQTFEFIDNALVTPDGMCLDVNGHRRTENGGEVQVWECTGTINQRWYYSPNTGQLVNEAGLCLDADGHKRGQNGGAVQVWQCLNNVNQRWYAEPI